MKKGGIRISHSSVRKILFNTLMAVILTTFVGLSLTYEPEVRFMPLIVAVPGMVLAVYNLIAAILVYVRQKKVRKQVDGNTEKAEKDFSKKEVWALIWLLGLFVGIYLFGFLIAVPIFMFLFLKVGSRESWVLSLSLPIGAWVMMYAFFIHALKVQLFDGILIELLTSVT